MAKKDGMDFAPSNDLENKRDYDAFFQKLGPPKLAWYAGLFQGESYFHTDKRRRAKTPSDEYEAAPPLPQIKLEMVEQDLMQSIALDLDQKLIEVNRKTTAGKQVYKVALYEREKVEAFLKAISPYIVGKKK